MSKYFHMEVENGAGLSSLVGSILSGQMSACANTYITVGVQTFYFIRYVCMIICGVA